MYRTNTYRLLSDLHMDTHTLKNTKMYKSSPALEKQVVMDAMNC